MFQYIEETMGFLSGDKAVRKYSDVGTVVNEIANVFVFIAFGVSFVALAFSFIQFITSTGDPKQTQRAQRAMLWSGVGMIASLLILAIKSALLKLLGVSGMY